VEIHIRLIFDFWVRKCKAAFALASFHNSSAQSFKYAWHGHGKPQSMSLFYLASRAAPSWCFRRRNLAVNLAGFRNCLAAYTVHSLSPCYGLLTALVLLNSVARCCNATKFSTKKCHFKWLCAWALEGIFPWGFASGFFQKFLLGVKRGEICFLPLEIQKTAFCTEIFKFLPLFRHPFACVSEKFVPHHKKFR